MEIFIIRPIEFRILLNNVIPFNGQINVYVFFETNTPISLTYSRIFFFCNHVTQYQ